MRRSSPSSASSSSPTRCCSARSSRSSRTTRATSGSRSSRPGSFSARTGPGLSPVGSRRACSLPAWGHAAPSSRAAAPRGDERGLRACERRCGARSRPVRSGRSQRAPWAGALAWITVESDASAAGAARNGVQLRDPRLHRRAILGALGELTSSSAHVRAVARDVALAALRRRFPRTQANASTGALRQALADIGFVGGLWLHSSPRSSSASWRSWRPSRSPTRAGGGRHRGNVRLRRAARGGLSPLFGRLSDRRGRLYPVRLALFGSIGAAIALSWHRGPLAIVPLVVRRRPHVQRVHDSRNGARLRQRRANGLPQGLGFGVMNTAWAIGAMTGPALGGALGTRSRTRCRTFSALRCVAPRWLR